MKIRLEARDAHHQAAVLAFNRRLTAANASVEFLLSEEPFRPVRRDVPVVKEGLLALDSEGEVRGGYLLQMQPAAVEGRILHVGNCQAPISEGIVSKRYIPVAILMMREALVRTPLLYAVGGAANRPFPRLLKAAGWNVRGIPFFFRVVRPARFFRNIRALRVTPCGRLGADLLAATGLGYLSIQAAQWRSRLRPGRRARVEPFRAFGSWTDELWARVQNLHSFCIVRNAATLECLYPPGDRCTFVRLHVAGEIVGWASILVSEMRDNRHFGNLRVGTIVDGLALPDYIPALVHAAAGALEDEGVDLIVTNQTDCRWIGAVRAAGFLAGPSNYALSLSPSIVGLLPDFERRQQYLHVTRVDGDGRIHL